MAQFAARFYLRRDEKVLISDGITPAWGLEQAFIWLLTFVVLLGGLTILVFAVVDPADRPNLLFGLAAAFLVLWLLRLIYTWRRIVTSEYVVTEEAVYTRRGQLLLAVDVATLDRVTDLHIHTGIFGRLFGYSRIIVKTAGGELVMQGMRDAYGVRGVVHEARQRLLTRLLREAGRDDAQQQRPRPAAGLQIECPSCTRAFGVNGKPPIDVVCPHCKATGTLFPEALA